MSNYDNPQLRYSCFSEPSLVSRSHPRSLTLTGPSIRPLPKPMLYSICDLFPSDCVKQDKLTCSPSSASGVPNLLPSGIVRGAYTLREGHTRHNKVRLVSYLPPDVMRSAYVLSWEGYIYCHEDLFRMYNLCIKGNPNAAKWSHGSKFVKLNLWRKTIPRVKVKLLVKYYS